MHLSTTLSVCLSLQTETDSDSVSRAKATHSCESAGDDGSRERRPTLILTSSQISGHGHGLKEFALLKAQVLDDRRLSTAWLSTA